MEKYNTLASKGNDNYINELNAIHWFDNPFIETKTMIENLQDASPIYLMDALTQFRIDIETQNIYFWKGLLEKIYVYFPNSSYEIKEIDGGVEWKFATSKKTYEKTVVFDDFEFGEGEDSFICTFFNAILVAESSEYRFFELPPSDETGCFIFVKPSVYHKALEIGLIPDFMGYFVINDL